MNGKNYVLVIEGSFGAELHVVSKGSDDVDENARSI